MASLAFIPGNTHLWLGNWNTANINLLLNHPTPPKFHYQVTKVIKTIADKFITATQKLWLARTSNSARRPPRTSRQPDAGDPSAPHTAIPVKRPLVRLGRLEFTVIRNLATQGKYPHLLPIDPLARTMRADAKEDY